MEHENKLARIEKLLEHVPTAGYNAHQVLEVADKAPHATLCHAGGDGDCIWLLCPQLRDKEPHTSGRHCPLDEELGYYDD